MRMRLDTETFHLQLEHVAHITPRDFHHRGILALLRIVALLTTVDQDETHSGRPFDLRLKQYLSAALRHVYCREMHLSCRYVLEDSR